MHFSLPKMCTLVLARSFALSLPKNLHLSFSPLEWRWVHTFRCQKRCTFRNAFFALSNGVIDRGSKQQSKRSNFRLHRSSFSPKKSKKWIKLIPKTIGNRKRDCAWGCAWGVNTTWENLQIEKHKSGRRSFRSPNWFVLFDVQVSQVVFTPQAQPHAQSLFLFPIVLGINYRKRRSASYIVREVHSVRERDTERERERRKWRHHCRAKIGDEFCTSPCQKCAP